MLFVPAEFWIKGGYKKYIIKDQEKTYPTFR
jgi:hypothetical protein